MNKKRLLIISVVFLICFCFINQIISTNVIAQENQIPKPKGILQRIGKILSKIVLVMQLFPVTSAVIPQTIEIGYNETVNVEVGMINLYTNAFENYKGGGRLQKQRYLYFDVLEYPSGNEYGNWQVVFNPPIVNVVKGTTTKTNVSIKLRSNRLSDKPIRSGVLKIGIVHVQAFGNLYRPPKGFSYWDTLGFRSLWTFFALVFPGWGKYFNGKVLTETFNVSILVKVKPVHEVNFYSVPYMVFKPNEVVSVPITLQNLGNYNDTYGFRVVSGNNDIKYAEPTSLTLAPGEKKDTYLGITIPQNFLDYGTLHKIKIQVYSIDQENVTIAERMLTLESKGIYFSEMSGFGIIGLIFILIIIFAFIFFTRRRIMEKICVKPEKPWDIPEEKEYLDQLKKQDKQKYNEVLNMMNDEYKSSLLWYNNYIRSILKSKILKEETPKKKERIFIKKEEKPKIEKVEEEIQKKSIPKIQKKEEKEVVEFKEKTLSKIDKEVENQKLKKERALQRVKMEQEKQKRKLNKLGL
jgi:hypothetical protein